MLCFYFTSSHLTFKFVCRANAETEKLLKEALEDAEVNHGETEVYEATLTIAYHHLRVGDKETTYSWLEKSKEKALSSAQKIDVMLRRAWVAFLYRDYEVVTSTIPAIEKIFENGGGDWDRKNRLKVYKGLISLVNRDFKEASDNFLSVVATFNTYELFSFSEFVILTTLTSMVTLDRVALKKSVVDSPEILSVIREAPDVEQFVLSFYNCDYKSFFQSLLKVHERISGDRFFSPHSDWFVRETRVGAYAQFLKSYLKVETVSMAHAFGVSKEFIDKELARFIAARRLNARMNKITGVIETSYTDERSGDFKAIIKEGDALLNRIQRLSRTINA